MNSMSEFLSIFAMQGFNGLSNFCVLLLMALGLAIIFGQMGVINMAHGEFLTIGAYTHLRHVHHRPELGSLADRQLLPPGHRGGVLPRCGRGDWRSSTS
jgi:branched-subunit amino acid ABC-type transport system permease component